MDFSAAEERILQATIDCIEQDGINQTTIRKIAERSGMNSAAISYYFRSKDNLIEKALEATLHYAFRWSDFVETEPMDFETQLIEIFTFLAIRAGGYPQLTRAHFHDVFANQPIRDPLSSYLNGFMEKIFDEGMRKRPNANPTRLRRALIQIMSSTMLYFGVFQPVFVPFESLTASTPDEKSIYVRQVVQSALSQIE